MAAPEPDSKCTAEFLENCECGECMVKDITEGKAEIRTDFKVTKIVTIYRSRSATCVKCGKKREGKFYRVKPMDRSPVPPPEADPPAQDAAPVGPEPADPPPPAGEQTTPPETAQKTPVPQSPPDSDVRRSEIKIPKFGRFGMSVIPAVVLFWDSRSVIRRIGFQMKHVAGVVLGTGTTFNMLVRTAACLAPEMSRILGDLLKSPYLHIDETVVWIAGRQMYIWVIATRTTVLYFPFSRHGAMLTAMLVLYTGIIISDGYRVYMRFKRRQRCWAHLLREARDLKKKINAQHADNFYLGLKDILKKAQEKKAAGVGPDWHDSMNAELERLLSYYSRYEDLMPVPTRHRAKRPRRLVYVHAVLICRHHQQLGRADGREVVKQRIMRQTLRTVEGIMPFTTLLSCTGTRRLSGLDTQKQLEKYVAA